MVATKALKNLASLTRGALKDARQAVDELITNLGHRAPTKPAVVKVPIRSGTSRPPVFNSPFRNTLYQYRNFTTSNVVKNSLVRKQYPIYQQPLRANDFSRRVPRNFANQLWSYSAFRRPLGGSRGPFPNGLYRNFYGLNSRNFSTYGPNFTREAIQNLTSSLRCFLSNAGELGADLLNSSNSKKNGLNYLSYDGCASQAQAQSTFKLAKCESTNIEKYGCNVEFTLPKLKLRMPSISFINDEVLATMESHFLQFKQDVDKVCSNIQAIFDTHGSLPLEKRRNSIRVHFPNLEVAELERLLRELEIREGIVTQNDEIEIPEFSQGGSGIQMETETEYGQYNDDDIYGDQYAEYSESTTPSVMSAHSFKSLLYENNEAVPALTPTGSAAFSTNFDSDFEGFYYPVLSDYDSDSVNSGNGIVMVQHEELFSPGLLEQNNSFVSFEHL